MKVTSIAITKIENAWIVTVRDQRGRPKEYAALTEKDMGKVVKEHAKHVIPLTEAVVEERVVSAPPMPPPPLPPVEEDDEEL